ncbi:MAG TPA: GNAT family N-acetyltransferase [Thermoplasmata archaeon]|nr:GNAT family N-acetyltransferase [Thermoplasmata archaeon]
MIREEGAPPTIFESQRLVVESLRMEHAAKLYAVLRDPRIYTFISDDPPSSVGDLEARFARYLKGPAPSSGALFLNWAVRLKTGGDYIGTLQATIDIGGRRASVAYLLGPGFWGKGLASEALGALLGWLFSRGGVISAEARIDTRNERSVRLVRRLGFELVRVDRKAEFFKGAWGDEYLFRILAPSHS